MRKVAGVLVAAITTNGGTGIQLPTWFLACATGAFFTATIAVVGVSVSTWSEVQQTSHQTQDNTQRIERLESLQTDMAAVKADISGIKDSQHSTNDKLDRLIDRELNGHPR